MSELYKIKGFDLEADGIEVHVHMRTTSARINKAHRNLKANIMAGMVPFMPYRNGDLIKKTDTANAQLLDDERMYAAAGTDAGGVPYGRMQYEGKVMVGKETGSPWARKDEEKVVTDRPLTWGKPNAGPHWFEVAKARYLDQWLKHVQEDLDGK